MIHARAELIDVVGKRVDRAQIARAGESGSGRRIRTAIDNPERRRVNAIQRNFFVRKRSAPDRILQVGIERREVARPELERRHALQAHHILPQEEAFVSAEEESAVAPQWAAQRAAELVAPQRRLFELRIGKEVSGIERVVADELPYAPMQLVGPAFGIDLDV